MHCWHRFNQTYQSDEIPQALATMTLQDSLNAIWFPDTGASAQVTLDPGKLHSLTHYFGPKKLMVGNGEVLDITHIGSTSIDIGQHKLPLNNVLVAPDIKRNLLSVSQMTSGFPYVFQFSLDGFVIKDR